MTRAQQAATDLGNDGQNWTDFDLICERHGGWKTATGYDFADNSVITVSDGGWDIGYPECGCWQEVGHTEKCSAAV